MIALLFTLPALAGAPTKVGATIPAGSSVGQIALTDDLAYAAIADAGSGELGIFDPSSFELFNLAACPGATGVAAATTTDGYRFWVGCDDGSVVVWDIDEAGYGAVNAWSVASGPIRALDTDGNLLYVLAEEDSSLHAYALDAGEMTAASGGSWGGAFANTKVVDTVLLSGRLLVVHGGDDVSWVDTSTGSIANEQESLGGRDWRDGYAYGTAAAYLADDDGAVVRWDSSTGYSILLDDLGIPVTGIYLDEDEGWMLAGTDDGTRVYSFSGAPGSQTDTLDGATSVGDMVGIDGYVLGVNDQDQIVVLTDRPWVEASEPSASTVTGGDEVTFSFTSDSSGSYTVVVGGTVEGDGSAIAAGSVTAGESVSATVTIDDSFAEGVNRVWVFVDEGGHIGHDAVLIEVDNPPSKVALTDGSVGVGDESVFVTIPGIADADVAGYAVYLSSAPFTADDFPTGGPAFEGPAVDDDLAAVDAPRAVVGGPGEDVEVVFDHLVNQTTYYVAVRAIDANANEGPMSAVIAATPEETYSASELRGDPGGYCATASPRAGLLLTAAAAGAALLRRRRGLVVGAVGVLLAGPAAAKDPDPPRFHAQLQGGLVTLADPYIQDVFGEYNVMVRGEYGVTTRFLEADVGGGYLHKNSYLLLESGGFSNEDDHLTIVPLSVNARARLDFFDEQIIVPFGGIGGDYWMWKERWWVSDGSDEDDRRAGGKLGWHWDAGAWLLLDPLDRRSASELEAKTGINDSYLTFEYRQTMMKHDANLLDFSDKEFLLGLKCDF